MTFLSWFGYERRGYLVTARVRSRLQQLGIATEPDFDAVGYYSQIRFVPSTDGVRVDPTIRLGRLVQASRPVVCCAPDDDIQKVLTQMMMNDFSQIPVLTGPRDVKGIVTWENIVRAEVKRPIKWAQDAMSGAESLPMDAPLSEAIPIIAKRALEMLGKILQIRNSVMHFDTDGIAPSEQKALDDLRRLLREIVP